MRAYADLGGFVEGGGVAGGPDLHLGNLGVLVFAGAGPCVATSFGRTGPKGDPAVFRFEDAGRVTVGRVRGVDGIGDGSRLRDVRAERIDGDTRVRFEWPSGRGVERWLLTEALVEPEKGWFCATSPTPEPAWTLSEPSRSDNIAARRREAEDRRARSEDLVPIGDSSSSP